ncbi:MAG: TIR domain-containing protein [Anaerolineae bacterium]|nr:TIR domain-containing protein [Anaerolineae bacterium]NUQ06752.1 TIR domain-containing protein [Anaerolineae bacterium]
MTRIFISYRRQDSEGHVGRLYDHLLKHFRAEDIFMDVASIEPGADFVDALERAVTACDVCLVVIGAQWATLTDGAGERRLHQWNDFVRIEIASALRANKRVIPLLVGGAKMPNPADLPEDVAGITRRQAVELTHARFTQEVEQIAAVIRANLSERLIKPKADAAQVRQKAVQIKALQAELLNAVASPLYAHRVANKLFPVLGDGSPDAAIVFIGEAPGKYEAAEGRVFVGPSGEVLNDLLAEIGLKRDSVFITNLLLDHPPESRDPTPEEIAFYAPYVDRLLAIIEPKVIVPLGRFAVQYLVKKLDLPDKRGRIGDLHGRVLTARMAHGEIHVVPMYHPAVALYQSSQRAVLKKDFEQLRAFV